MCSGRAEQATYGQYVPFIKDNGVTWVYDGSNDQAMLKMKREAAAQGLDTTGIQFVCSLACYTPDMLEQGGADAEGVWVNMQFIPFNETDTNEELATFIDYIGDPFPPSWAAWAWGAGLLFEQVVNEIVAEDGPNGLTRQAMLDHLAAVESFDGNGWFSPLDFTAPTSIGNCYVLHAGSERRVRAHPPGGTGNDGLQPGQHHGHEQLDAAARFRG